jgi:hypothetical protein
MYEKSTIKYKSKVSSTCRLNFHRLISTWNSLSNSNFSKNFDYYAVVESRKFFSIFFYFLYFLHTFEFFSRLHIWEKPQVKLKIVWMRCSNYREVCVESSIRSRACVMSCWVSSKAWISMSSTPWQQIENLYNCVFLRSRENTVPHRGWEIRRKMKARRILFRIFVFGEISNSKSFITYEFKFLCNETLFIHNLILYGASIFTKKAHNQFIKVFFIYEIYQQQQHLMPQYPFHSL